MLYSTVVVYKKDVISIYVLILELALSLSLISALVPSYLNRKRRSTARWKALDTRPDPSFSTNRAAAAEL